MINHHKVKRLAEIHADFIDAIIQENISEDVWHYYHDFRDDIVKQYGLPNLDVEVDHEGARYVRQTEEDPQSAEVNGYFRDLRRSLNAAVRHFNESRSQNEWEPLMECLREGRDLLIDSAWKYLSDLDWKDIETNVFQPDDEDELVEVTDLY